jgi:N-acetylglucosaminyldiphosphoundecaprenol N-acetyl-beta-D-mannosaminyltransferase
MRRTVLGINIDDVSKEEALGIVSSWLTPNRYPLTAKLIFTPGPEFLVTAQKDEEFKKILNSSDLNIPDGFGLQLFGGVKNRIAGVDFMLALCQQAAKNGWTVGLLGGGEGVAYKTKEVLEKKFPKIKIVLAVDGKKADKIVSGYEVLNTTSKPIDILFVALGHPKQEKFLWQLSANCYPLTAKYFRVGMGVGGSFDFISGIVSEPPAFLSKLGLKWLGRLISRPGYMLPKIWKAVILYPWLSLSRILRPTGG